MHTLRQFAARLPLAALFLPLLFVATSCSRFNTDGSLAPWGILLVILDIWALVNIFGKSWDFGKKIIWAAIVFFFPFGGLVLYYIFGRNS